MRISGINDKISRCMLKILDLNIRKSSLQKNTPEFLECSKNIKKFEADLERIKYIKAKVLNTIENLPNSELKYIVQMYFLSGEKVENIATRIRRTRKHVYDVIGKLRQDIGGYFLYE